MIFMIIFSSSAVFSNLSINNLNINNAQATKSASLIHSEKAIYTQPRVYEISSERNIKYAQVDGMNLELDLYRPKNFYGKSPVIVWIHGGAWRSGSKEGLNPSAKQMVASGYTVASVNYRLNYHDPFPAQIHDVKGAIRWLRANSEEFRLDNDKFAVWGTSAGGHLASLLGTSNNVDEMEGSVGGNLDYSSEVQLVINSSGVYDFLSYQADCDVACSPNKFFIIKSQVEKLLNCSFKNCNAQKAMASPKSYLSNDDPMFLHIHSTGDNVIPSAQSQKFHEDLISMGVRSELILVSLDKHGGFDEEYNSHIQNFIADNFGRQLVINYDDQKGSQIL